MLIGLTGLYCAGKNHVGALLEKRGIPVLDADKLGHTVINQKTESIVRRFGQKILGPDGKIDRQLLGKLVFGRPHELSELEAMVHPGVNCLAEEWIGCQKENPVPGLGKGSCVINAALLQKSSVCGKFGAIIVVCAPLPVRLFRSVKRDKLPIRELLKRFISQKDFPLHKTGKNGSQLFFPGADIYTIHNSGFNGSPEGLEKRITAILDGLKV